MVWYAHTYDVGLLSERLYISMKLNANSDGVELIVEHENIFPFCIIYAHVDETYFLCGTQTRYHA